MVLAVKIGCQNGVTPCGKRRYADEAQINTWVNIGVVFADLGLVPSYWPMLVASQQSRNVASDPAAQSTSVLGATMNPTALDFLRYGSPVLASVMLLVTVWVALCENSTHL